MSKCAVTPRSSNAGSLWEVGGQWQKTCLLCQAAVISIENSCSVTPMQSKVIATERKDLTKTSCLPFKLGFLSSLQYNRVVYIPKSAEFGVWWKAGTSASSGLSCGTMVCRWEVSEWYLCIIFNLTRRFFCIFLSHQGFLSWWGVMWFSHVLAVKPE